MLAKAREFNTRKRAGLVYEMTDVQGNVAISKPVYFEIKNGEIYTTIE